IDGRELAYREKHNLPADARQSCACHILDDVLVTILPESQAQKQIVRKTATERIITLDPAVRQHYVEVQAATLEDTRGDWERLRDALREQWGLERLSIDYTQLLGLQKTLRDGNWAVTVSVWDEREVIRVQPGYAESAVGFACDVGTTTVAGHLCDLRTGAVLATEAMMNPQVTYGEDLMSRVSYAMMRDDGLDVMHRAIIDGLNALIEQAAQAVGLKPTDVVDLCLVGNTTMHHILLGINPIELGGAPFALAIHDPIDVKARDLGLRAHPGAYVHVLPCQAGHVGADNTAVALAEEPHTHENIILIVDVGTNAELLLGNRERVLSASSPTGPAFEGAQIRHGQRAAPGAIERVRIDPITLAPRFKIIGRDEWSDEWAMPADLPEARAARARALRERALGGGPLLATGICGSGIIEAVAELYLAGVISHDGRFKPSIESPHVKYLKAPSGNLIPEYILATADQSATGRPIVVVQDDVRAIQLAKAALYAGAKLLMAERGVLKVDEVILAGAFGSYIDPQHAMILGLIPDCDLAKVHAVGNAAGDGARIALLSRAKRKEAARVARWIQHVQTAVAPNFQDEFVGAIHIPHAVDPFPHLEGLLPKREAGVVEDRETRRARRRAA
ncbi:MAG: DUF4445 domain-containing protein, partial [Chloroflexi bacterium]|nr:DUF4445 domain-containing protein [Chloroflexota bacterium]